MLLNRLTELGYDVEVTLDSILHPYSEMTQKGRADNLKYRVKCANAIGKDSIFISIHANAHDDSRAKGYEIYIPSAGKGGNSEKLANCVLEGANNYLGVGSTMINRGVKVEDFYVIKNTAMPAILIEHGFYTNPEERELLKTYEFKRNAINAIIHGIEKFTKSRDVKYDFLSKKLKTGDVLYYMNKKGSYKSIFEQSKEFDGNIRYIKADPLNVGIITGYNTVKATGYCGVNGTFFWEKNHNGIIKIKDTVISEYSSRYWSPDEAHYPQSVLCYYRDGSFGIEKIKTAHEISKPVWWAIGGIGLLSQYGYNPISEGFIGIYSDVLRKTNHTSIGVTGDNKVILARSYDCSRTATADHMKALGCKLAVGLDSGSSCQIVTPKWKRPTWSARKVPSMIVVTDL